MKKKRSFKYPRNLSTFLKIWKPNFIICSQVIKFLSRHDPIELNGTFNLYNNV